MTGPIPLATSAAPAPALFAAAGAAPAGESVPPGLFSLLLAALSGEASEGEAGTQGMGESEAKTEDAGDAEAAGEEEKALAVTVAVAVAVPMAVPLPLTAPVPSLVPAAGPAAGDARSSCGGIPAQEQIVSAPGPVGRDRTPADGAAGRTPVPGEGGAADWADRNRPPAGGTADGNPVAPPSFSRLRPVEAWGTDGEASAAPAAGMAPVDETVTEVPVAPPSAPGPAGDAPAEGGDGAVGVRPLGRAAPAPASPVAFGVKIVAHTAATPGPVHEPPAGGRAAPPARTSSPAIASARPATPSPEARPPLQSAGASAETARVPDAANGEASGRAAGSARADVRGDVPEDRPADVPADRPAPEQAPAGPRRAASQPAEPAQPAPAPSSGDVPERVAARPAPPPAVELAPHAAASEVRAPAAPARAAVAEPAPVRPVEPPVAGPGARTEPVRDLAFRLEGGSDPVEVRLSERGGAVHVAVHTADADLAGTLRQNLGELETRLEGRGYQAEAWQPRAAGEAARAGSEAGHPPGSGGQPYQGRGGDGESRRRQNSKQNPARRDTKEFAWIVSSIR